jgi:CRP-like cAMP-binding protein
LFCDVGLSRRGQGEEGSSLVDRRAARTGASIPQTFQEAAESDLQSDDPHRQACWSGSHKEGERGRELFIVLEGELEVRRGDRLIARRGPGDYVGEIALLDERPRTATVVATTPISLEVLSRREFSSLLANVPELSKQITATMAERLAELEAGDARLATEP